GGADVQLLGDHVLGDDRIGLDGPGPARAGEADRGVGERAADPAPAEARAREQARHRPDAGVGLVLVATLPRHAKDARPALVVAARLDGAPPGGLAVEIGDQPARAPRGRVTAFRLLVQALDALLDRERAEGLARRQLVALAPAARRRAARAEDRLQVRA